MISLINAEKGYNRITYLQEGGLSVKSVLFIAVLFIFCYSSFANAQVTSEPEGPTRLICPATAKFDVILLAEATGGWVVHTDDGLQRVVSQATAILDDVEMVGDPNPHMICLYKSHLLLNESLIQGGKDLLKFELIRWPPADATCVARKVSFPDEQMYFDCTYE